MNIAAPVSIIDKAAMALEAEMLAPLVAAGYVRGPSDLILAREIVKTVLKTIREPSMPMLAAGCQTQPEGGSRASVTQGQILYARWVAMIDAALESQP